MASGKALWGVSMNYRDQQLLDKQLKWMAPTPRHNGLIILMIAGMFLAGVSLGGTLLAQEAKTAPAASGMR